MAANDRRLDGLRHRPARARENARNRRDLTRKHVRHSRHLHSTCLLRRSGVSRTRIRPPTSLKIPSPTTRLRQQVIAACPTSIPGEPSRFCVSLDLIRAPAAVLKHEHPDWIFALSARPTIRANTYTKNRTQSSFFHSECSGVSRGCSFMIEAMGKPVSRVLLAHRPAHGPSRHRSV